MRQMARKLLAVALTAMFATPTVGAQAPSAGEGGMPVTQASSPVRRLDFSQAFRDAQDPDPTGLIQQAGDAADEGVSGWTVGALLLMGLGGTLALYSAEYLSPQADKAYDDYPASTCRYEDDPVGCWSDIYEKEHRTETTTLNAGLACMVGGAGLLVAGTILSDRFWVVRVPGGAAAGARLRLGPRSSKHAAR